MSRRTVPLRVDHLADLPERERSCLFWQLGPVDRARLAHDERAGEKETWTSTVLREWGTCGRVAVVDDQQVGYAVYAPTASGEDGELGSVWAPGNHAVGA
jgi:hypothetical protein